MEKIIVINSNDKNSQSLNNSNFSVDLRETYSTQQVKRVIVKEVIVPNSFYNIRSSQGEINNVLKMKENGQADINVSIAEGQYTITTFITALQTAINLLLVSGTVAITQDAINNKLIFTFTGTTALIYGKTDLNLMSDVIGFVDTTADGAVLTAEYIPDLSGINLIFIHSPDLSDNHGIDADFGLINSLDSLSFHDVPYGAFGYKQSNDANIADIIFDIPKNIKRITIIVYDNKGNKLNIGTMNMTVVLKVLF